MRTPLIFAMGFVSLFVAIECPAQAKDYPERPVKIIVPFPPGGAVDVIARTMAQKLSEGLGGQFFIENLSGASGAAGTGTAANAAADGHTIL